MTPLERAAKAAREETSAYAVDGGWMTEGGVVGDDHWEDIARAVLQAIREPSEAMISAGSEVEFAERSWPGGEDNETMPADIAGAWRSMIDAALAGT